MDKLIVEKPITGNTVYGVAQAEYAVEGVSGQNFIDAVTTASFKQADAIERSAQGYTSVVRARQQKVSELGEVLAEIARAIGRLKAKAKTSDTATVDNASWVQQTAAKYGIDLSMSGSKMKFGDLHKAQTNIQYAIDKEDNTLQQDIVSMQSYITKRDNAFSNAAKIVEKANNAAKNTIKNIGR